MRFHCIAIYRSSLEKIIEDFEYCKVTFEHHGDFQTVSALNVNILEATVKEALTNTAKYAEAKHVQIRIDIGKRHLRLFYKDDGKGCESIHESLGILGMRERVRNVGGTVSIDGKEGFLIVCHLPITSDA